MDRVRPWSATIEASLDIDFNLSSQQARQVAEDCDETVLSGQESEAQDWDFDSHVECDSWDFVLVNVVDSSEGAHEGATLKTSTLNV